MSNEKQILQFRAKGCSQRRIADTLKVSRNTVAKVFNALETHPIPEDILTSITDQEVHGRLFPEDLQSPVLVTPDYDYIHKEMLKSGVTLKLLWEDYVDSCRRSGKPPYMYSQFCKVYLFVATLPFSMYCFTKACLTMKEEDWINVHISMYEYFDASTRLLIPDNLKTGVLSHKKYEDPVINRAYQELADYYQTALLPARVLAPKDKTAVEGTAGQVTSHIIARLRNRQFFDIHEMNSAIRKELDRFNCAEFQKKDGSRYFIFMEEELPFMQPLPGYPYEFAQWKTATVQLNYHIAIDNQNYSVPYEYVKKKVDVRYTKSMIEVFYKGSRICSHKRLYGRRGQYSTLIDHMPVNHQLYSEWDSARFLKWASAIGTSTKEVVQKLFDSYRVEEQAYKGCLSLLKLADKYSAERLENACSLALIRIPSPRYKNIRLILEAGQEKKRVTMRKILPRRLNPFSTLL